MRVASLIVSTLFLLVICHASSYDSQAIANQLIDDGFVPVEDIFNRKFVAASQTVFVDYEDHQVNKEQLDKFLALGQKTLDSNLTDVGFFEFLPITIGKVMNGASLSWSSRCFDNVTATLSTNSVNGTLTIKASGHHEASCFELYTFGTRQGIYLDVLDHIGTSTYVIVWHEYEWSDVLQFGVGVYVHPLDVEETAASIVRTIQLFKGQNSTMRYDDAVEFYGEHIQWAIQPRNTGVVNITEDQIHSGDYFGLSGLSGLANLISWGTGSYTSHTTVALWFPDGLYICESNADGVHRTPWKQWFGDGGGVKSFFPLRPDLREKFNTQAAIDWFNTVDGMPYGYNNFIFTFLDTPDSNMPRPFTQAYFEVFAGVWERFIPFGEQGSLYSMMIMGLNHRLGTNCTTLQCIYRVIDPKGLTLSDICAIPEQDSWTYNGNYSMVCDSFVVAMYKHAGIFGDLTDSIQATEQTPKDTYSMAIFDANWQRPKACHDADPALPYCQTGGEYVQVLPFYNSIPPYAHMNEVCPSLSPVFYRPYGC